MLIDRSILASKQLDRRLVRAAVRNERNRQEYGKIVQSSLGLVSLDPLTLNQRADPRALVKKPVKRTEPDMNRFACSETLDCMEA